MSVDVAEDDPTWKEACRREEVIRDLLRRHPERLTVRAVEDVAWELGLSRATTYRLIERYRGARTVEVLRERQRGWPKGRLRDEPVRDGSVQRMGVLYRVGQSLVLVGMRLKPVAQL